MADSRTNIKSIAALVLAFAVLTGMMFVIQVASKDIHEYDVSVIAFGAIVLAAGLFYDRKTLIIFTVLCAVTVVVFFFPLKHIGLFTVIGSLVVFAVLYIYSDYINSYNNGIRIRQEELDRETEALETVRAEKIVPAKNETEALDKEIKDITSLYTAAKDLSASLRMEESIGVISQIIKKMLKNFRISIDDIAYVLTVKKDHEFVIADSHGYDEEIIKDNNKALISFILKNVPKTGDLTYSPTVTGDDNIATFSFIKSIIYMPFYIDKRLLGVLFLSGKRENLFTPSQVEKMKILSNYIAISLEKAYLYDEVEQMSIKDGLTGLYVHRYFQDKLENELKRAARYGTALSLVMCDIDFFKKINDTYGHLAGDFILKTLALILKNNTTPIDTVARYGGEEFILIMPEMDKEKAHARAVKIRKEVEKYNFKFNENYIKCTISMGVASYPNDAITRRALIEKADKALYKAKEEGRNRVIKA